MYRRPAGQAEFDPHHRVAGRPGRHDEGGYALGASLLAGAREDQGDVGVLARGDELLGAVEHIGVAVTLGPRG